MRDLNEVIRTELQKDQEANPRQKLMMKRHQQVAEDNFKSNNRLINVKKRPGDEEEEKGMGLLHLNLDRQKIEREAKKQQYKYELGQQLKEREGINQKDHLVDKISHMPPAIYSANLHRKEDSRVYQPPPERIGAGYNPPPSKDPNAYYRGQPERGNFNDRADNFGNVGGNVLSEDGFSVIKPSSANYPERVPSANEYYSLSIPDQNPPKRESAFQKASSANLANFSKGDYRGQPGQLGANNEFFDKHFGEAHDRKKRQQQEMKDQLVADLQVQMELKKERERREKAQKALEDHRAEERYLKELNKINEYSVAESKKRQPNLFAEGLNDNDIAADFRKEKEQSNPRSVSLKTIPREPEMHSVHVAEAHSISRPNPELSVTSKPPERLKINEVSFAGGKEQPSTYGHVHSVTGQPTGRDYEALGAAVQHHQPMPAKYQEYSQRVADFGVERMDEKKRELRMNTNLLYQQLIDLRGEKNYTDNLKEQAFQNFDTVKRNLEKQNKILNTEIRSLMGAESLVDEDLVASRSYAKDRPFNPLGWGSDPSAPETKRLAEYRKQGLKLVDDVATRPRHSADPTRLDYRLQPDQGGLSTTDEGEIVMVAETELIPVKYKQVDRHALSKFEHLDQSDIVSAAKKEARQERITDQIKYQSPDERLEDLKRKNLDFDTLMNEMAKECRHIYEDEIGIRPIKRGEGVDTLDQIIDNLYNDDFKVKNLPPKTKTTTTEPAQTSPIDNHPKNTDKKPSTFSLHHGAGQASQGDRPHARVLVSPENLFDSFGGNDSTQHEKKPSPNPFLLDSYAEDRPPSGDQESHRLPQFATTSPPHHLSANNSELSPGHLSPGPSNGKPKGKQDASGFDNTAVSGQLSFGQPGTDRHGEMSFADPLKKDASRLSEAKKTGDEEDQIEQGSHREEIEAEEEGEEAGEEGGEEAEEEDQQEDADVEDEEQASEGSVHEEVEEEADEKADRNDGKNSRHSKNSSLGDDGRPNKPGESKVLGGQGNADASRAEDLRKSDSKKKVTFSSEIENKNHK